MIPLVLLPGLGSDHALWSAQVRDLADVAHPGIGDTLNDDNLTAMAARVLAAAPDRFALAGLSMGGYLAFEIWRQAPQRVLRLALLDTSARPDTPEQTAYRRQAIATAEGHADFARLARFGLDQLLHPDTPEAVREAVVAMSVRVGPHRYAAQQPAIIGRRDSRSTLGTITVPTLVLVGEQDMLTRPPSPRRSRQALWARHWRSCRKRDTCRQWSSRRRWRRI
ncbi:alpha/beta fold hydrolase [Sphingomonas aracearum]|uniref:alpha/beta fold hydrolase n=1 Tax=Sphingomonas aracearum TaxID=2283317 RepID=UPI001EF142A2|nr:alpha/beta hydrolase [Sphingomonas aracearum]